MTSAGREAVELAARAGLCLDPWQGFGLDGALGETAEGRWAAFEVVLLVQRQNGKGGDIEARELSGLYLFEEELILHSAHEFKTAQEAFLRIRWLIEGTDEFRRRVARVRTAHGDEGIELLASPTVIMSSEAAGVRHGRAPRLRFVARTGGSGRGFSGDCVILDEAFNLPDVVMSALLPTLSARPNPQLWYVSTAVNQDEHPYGLTLAKLRARGLAGDDPSLAFMQWCADEERYHSSPEAAKEVAADPAEWAAANPALGIRISAEHIAREHRSMTTKGFAVERLGIGDWPSVDEDAEEWVIPEQVWTGLADPASTPRDPVAFAVDATPDRRHAAVGVGGRREDGRMHGEVAEHRSGMGWVVEWLTAPQPHLEDRSRVTAWGPCAVLLDPAGPAGSLIPSLREAGVEPVLVTAREMAQACGALHDLCANDGFRHLDQAPLTDALAGARRRDLADAWAWSRRDSSVDISPLVAVTLAVHGFAVHGHPEEQAPPASAKVAPDPGPGDLWRPTERLSL